MLADDASELSSEEKSVLGERLGRTRNAKANLRIERGDTVFVVRTVTVPRRELPGKSLDYEGIVSAIKTSKGLFVDDRIDRISFVPAPRNKVTVSLRYAVGVLPDAKKNGNVSFRLSLVKRKGFGEVALSLDGKHKVRVRRPIASAMDLSADFRGYRIYRLLAAKHAAALKQRGVRGLTLTQGSRLPPMVKMSPTVVNGVFQFDRWKRRMWIAHRHLITAANLKDQTLSGLAESYLANLDQPKEKIAHLLKIPMKINPDKIAEAQVQDLSDESSGAQASAQSNANSESSDIVEPLNERSTPSNNRPTRKRPRLEPTKPAQRTTIEAISPSKSETAEAEVKSKNVGTELDYIRGQKAIPSHPRFLRLSDPNVSFGGAVRLNYQEVTTTETAKVPTMFAELQVPLTTDFGVGFTLPLAYVDVDLARTETVITIGNPILEAKYRFHLPEISSSRPSIAVRTTWAIPASHSQKISPTTLPAEEFVLAAEFTETSAFLYERHALGGGLSSSWTLGPIHFGAEVLFEYLLPISDGLSTTTFPILSYGAAVGYRPFGELLGVYLESQGATLLLGPRRNEVTTYGGVRSQAFDFIELAAWAAVTVAPDARPTNLSVGGELRFVYDVDSLIIFGSSTRKFGDVDWAN